MNENLNTPGNNPPEPPEFSTNQPQQPMEVHHHGHVHHKTKWKEYFFQFLMLFLAVFLGFLAENLREHIEEKKREKEYIKSLIVDLGVDKASINIMREKIAEQILGFDTLQTLFSSDLKNSPNDVYDCYYYSAYLQLSYPVNFNERTITQLLSSGNMRLIKTTGVADSLMEYFNIIKDVDVQKQMYVDHINKCTESMYNVYDISYLRRRVGPDDSLIFVTSDWSNIKLLSTDPAILSKLSASLEVTKLIIHGYKLYLELIDEKATRLRNFLQSQYHLEG